MRRVRRPLLALIVLVAVLVIGYTIKAITSANHDQPPSPAPSVSVSR